MKLSVCLIVVTLLAGLVFGQNAKKEDAAATDKPLFWSSAQNKQFDQQALSKLNAERHLGTERLLDAAFVAFRNGPGEAEIHEKLADLLLIRSGEGTVLVGGKVIEGKATAAGEVRGKSIEGPTAYPITAGDILYIPAGVVHQFQVLPGQKFTAMVIKLAPR